MSVPQTPQPGARLPKSFLTIAFLAVATFLAATVGAESRDTLHVTGGSQIDSGRYLVLATGCNHCHTEGWKASNGTSPESQWLKGGHLTPKIPGPNLRTFVASVSEQDFVNLFHKTQPIQEMPFFNLRQMSSQDLKAMYAYIHSLK